MIVVTLLLLRFRQFATEAVDSLAEEQRYQYDYLRTRKASHYRMKRRATVTDVAELAQAGASTVSRYLRGIPVRPYIATRIAKAIKELGYEPDQTARALRNGRSQTIGVIVPKISNAFFSHAVQLFEEEIRQSGSTIMLLTHQDRIEQMVEHLSTLRRCKADGVILTGAPGTALKEVRAALPDVPIVAFDAQFSTNTDAVLLKNREAAHYATEHLIQHGYKKIACVTAKPDIYSYQERIAGYEEAVEGRKLRPQLITAPNYDELRFALEAALRGKSMPSALLSLSDFCTLNILSTFDELGMAKEDRPALIGFDDFDFAPYIDPSLTVIRQPIETMVRSALNMLMRRIDEPDSNAAAQSITLAGDLICRRSCGCR